MLATARVLDATRHTIPPHIGALCRGIRTSRDVDAAHMVRWCGVRHTSNITRNFEELGMTSDVTFERYVQALQTREFVNPPLMERQAAILRKLWRYRRDTEGIENNLTTLSFEQIRTRRRCAELACMVEQLAHIGQPAWIMDDLWFVHAVNGAMLRLFGIDTQETGFLGQWYGWHALASACCANSPLRRSYAYTDQFLPPTIVSFLENKQTYPLLFTIQMRELIERTIALSEQEGCEFQHWWKQATAFYLPYSLTSLARPIVYQGRVIYAEPRMHSSHTVSLAASYTAHYTLALWWPVDRDAAEAFEDIEHMPASNDIAYAADYDRRHDFHVNNWPEVGGAFKRWLQR